MGSLTDFPVCLHQHRLSAEEIKRKKETEEKSEEIHSDLTSNSYSGGYNGIDISKHQGGIHWQISQSRKSSWSMDFLFK